MAHKNAPDFHITEDYVNLFVLIFFKVTIVIVIYSIVAKSVSRYLVKNIVIFRFFHTVLAFMGRKY